MKKEFLQNKNSTGPRNLDGMLAKPILFHGFCRNRTAIDDVAAYVKVFYAPSGLVYLEAQKRCSKHTYVHGWVWNSWPMSNPRRLKNLE